MYIVRFNRKDNKPNEDYYYNNIEDAMEHLNIFLGDDSNLYKRIDLIEIKDGDEEIISYLLF